MALTGAPSPASCLYCARGYFMPQHGATSCFVCPSGFYGVVTGAVDASRCLPCSRGLIWYPGPLGDTCLYCFCTGVSIAVLVCIALAGASVLALALVGGFASPLALGSLLSVMHLFAGLMYAGAGNFESPLMAWICIAFVVLPQFPFVLIKLCGVRPVLRLRWLLERDGRPHVHRVRRLARDALWHAAFALANALWVSLCVFVAAVLYATKVRFWVQPRRVPMALTRLLITLGHRQVFSLAPARDTWSMMWEGRLPLEGGEKRVFAANYYNEMTMLELLAHAIPQV